MQVDFGEPPISAENRVLVEQRLEEVRKGQGVPETLTVEFRGQPRHVEVIDMPVSRLFYNPGTHRIRAQRSHDPERDLALQKDPWSDESQDYLHYLLKAAPTDPSKRDPKFDDLMGSLREHKQNEPGLITRDGVIVNGNTRRAALKELGVTSIRVGVLPASCTWADIHAVELSLQLRPDRRREYSYINHLLALDEQVALGRQLSDIARDFHTTTPACERDIWILNQLRDLIQRSKHNGLSLRLMDFEDAKEKLFELYRAYSKEHAKNKEKADLLKEARLAAIVLDFSKTDVRYIGPDFQTRFLEQRLPESAKPSGAAAPAAVTIPGLNRTVQAAGAQVAAARALTNSLLQAKAVQVVSGKATPAQLTAASETFTELKEAFDEAIEFAGKDYRLRKKRQAAPDRVNDACKDLEQCITDLVLARGNGSLDEGAFDDALLNLRSVMRKLAVEASKSIPLPGEGVSWLRDVTATER
ncbi:ParB N-terminal domain-containing protein [Streptomyces desertarenae]|uniref:ParB N-terminal domain-containing protein n=1 Tax=Streptomyces desertarenae TaxID=2666184 RepID=A0ABW4PS94_9ACTN